MHLFVFITPPNMGIMSRIKQVVKNFPFTVLCSEHWGNFFPSDDIIQLFSGTEGRSLGGEHTSPPHTSMWHKAAVVNNKHHNLESSVCVHPLPLHKSGIVILRGVCVCVSALQRGRSGAVAWRMDRPCLCISVPYSLALCFPHSNDRMIISPFCSAFFFSALCPLVEYV